MLWRLDREPFPHQTVFFSVVNLTIRKNAACHITEKVQSFHLKSLPKWKKKTIKALYLKALILTEVFFHKLSINRKVQHQSNVVDGDDKYESLLEL